jgi:hypothetical protein
MIPLAYWLFMIACAGGLYLLADEDVGPIWKMLCAFFGSVALVAGTILASRMG